MSITISQPFKQNGQFPVDGGVRFLTLAEMTVVGNNPYAYYEDMIVRCIENHRNYIWREVTTPGETGGVMTQNFTYPQGASGGGIDYSNREFNFFPHKEEAETRVPDNVFFVSNFTELTSALTSTVTSTSNIIYLTNDITISGNMEISGLSKHCVILNSGQYKNRILIQGGANFRISGDETEPLEINVPIVLPEQAGTATISGQVWIRAKEITGNGSFSVNESIRFQYEYIDSRISLQTNTSETIEKIYWSNTNKTTQFKLPDDYIFVSDTQEFIDALELDLIHKAIVLTNSVVLNNQSITYRGNCTILDTGRTISTIGFGIDGPISINAQSFNHRLDILCSVLISSITSHTTTIEGNGNVFLRSIRGNSNLILQGSIRFQYEYISPSINLTNNSSGLVQQDFWHNTNKTSPTVGLTTEQLNTLNSLVGSEDMTIPIKDNGVFKSSGIRKLDDGSLLAPKNFGIESGSIMFGDLVKLSEVSGFLAITNMDLDTQFALLDTRFDKTFGTYRPRFFNLTSGEVDIEVQDSEINQITNTRIIMPITVPSTGQVNSIDFKIFDQCTNVRMRLTKDSSGVVFKYLPNKESWVTAQGGYDLSGTTIQNIPLGDTQLRLIKDEDYTLEIVGDEINFLGNPSEQPYLSVKAQAGEFTELSYSLKPFAYLASSGAATVTGNTYIAASLSGNDGVINLDPEAKNGDIVKLTQINNIGNNKLTFQTLNNQNFVYQKIDGTQIIDNQVIVDKSITVEFIKDGNTWRFYNK